MKRILYLSVAFGALALTTTPVLAEDGEGQTPGINATHGSTVTSTNTSMGQTDLSVVGYFTDIPNCAAPDPVVTENHGDCVSSAAHAGVKGKDLAAIAKVVTKVGVFNVSTTCKV